MLGVELGAEKRGCDGGDDEVFEGPDRREVERAEQRRICEVRWPEGCERDEGELLEFFELPLVQGGESACVVYGYLEGWLEGR